MKYQPGQDVTVTIQGKEHRGEVIVHEPAGFVTCKVIIDPAWDYGSTTWVNPAEQTVCVRDKWVTPFSPATSGLPSDQHRSGVPS